MAKYKVSGVVSESCTVYIFQNDDYKGKHYIPAAGNYATVFDAAADTEVIALAMNSSGRIVGYGEVTAVSSEDTVTVSGTSSGILTVKGIQQGYASLAPTVATGDVLISTIDLTKSVVECVGSLRDNSDATQRGGRINVYFLDDHTLRITRSSPADNVLARIAYRVTEYSSGVNSIQSGSSFGGQWTNTDINLSTAVNVDKSIFISGGEYYSFDPVAFVGFNSPTQFRVKIGDSAAYLRWTILEYV